MWSGSLLCLIPFLAVSLDTESCCCFGTGHSHCVSYYYSKSLILCTNLQIKLFVLTDHLLCFSINSPIFSQPKLERFSKRYDRLSLTVTETVFSAFFNFNCLNLTTLII